MVVHGLANSQVQSGAYALILAEKEGNRRVPIIVGMPEAQSIAIAMEQIHTPRPLTHDLMVSMLSAFHLQIDHVLIYKFEDGIYYAELECMDRDRGVLIDARTSDAIALALRMHSKIYMLSHVLDECGVETAGENGDSSGDVVDPTKPLDAIQLKDEQTVKRWLSHATLKMIQECMQKAVEEENYEYAKLCQEELRRRNNGGE